MDGFDLDTSQVDALVVDLGKAGRKATLAAAAVIGRGALNIKAGMAADIAGSPHFKRVAASISYDVRGLSAEIGPEVGRGAGSLAFIAAYGTSRTPATWDHTAALRRELPNIEKFLGQAGIEAL